MGISEKTAAQLDEILRRHDEVDLIEIAEAVDGIKQVESDLRSPLRARDTEVSWQEIEQKIEEAEHNGKIEVDLETLQRWLDSLNILSTAAEETADDLSDAISTLSNETAKVVTT